MRNHDHHRQLQDEIWKEALSILKKNDQVLGIVLAGSMVRGEQDAFSDIDAACYFRSEERLGRAESYERIAALRPTLCKLWIYDKHALYLFDNGVRLDLDFLRPSDLQTATYVYNDYRVVYDPDGETASTLAKYASHPAAEHPKWFQPGDPDMIDWFFWMFRQIVCWAKRGEQGDYRAFNKLTNAVDSLAQVRTRLVEMRLWTLDRMDYLPRADADLARLLTRTFPHLEPVEIIQCAELLLEAFENVCPPYCLKTGAAYPAVKTRQTWALIEEYKALA
jgi:predicted nucleotidyltransferase